MKLAKKGQHTIRWSLVYDVFGTITGGSAQSHWSIDFSLVQVRLRAAAEELYRCLNNKEITLDLTNHFSSSPEKGLQWVMWESHIPSPPNKHPTALVYVTLAIGREARGARC